jgi:hypothetical protein
MASRWRKADVPAVIRFLNSRSTTPDSSGWGPVELPWALLAEDYLGFARTDLRQGSTRGSVNALGNAKRALHCRIDSVLFTTGFWPQASSKRWNFNQKEELLTEIHVITPKVLRRINQLRNQVEHEYSAPQDRDRLADFIDTIELFLASTDRAAKGRYDSAGFATEKGGRSVEVSFNGDPVLSARLFGDAGFEKEITTRDFAEFRTLQAAVFGAAKRGGEFI